MNSQNEIIGIVNVLEDNVAIIVNEDGQMVEVIASIDDLQDIITCPDGIHVLVKPSMPEEVVVTGSDIHVREVSTENSVILQVSEQNEVFEQSSAICYAQDNVVVQQDADSERQEENFVHVPNSVDADSQNLHDDLNQDYDASKWNWLFTEKTSDYNGYVRSLDDLSALIQAYQDSTNTSYSLTKQGPGFAAEYKFTRDKKLKILYQDSVLGEDRCIRFDGVPFVNMAKKIYTCRMRSERDKTSRDSAAETPSKELGPRLKLSSACKSCKARIIVKAVAKFPEFKVENDRPYTLQKYSVQLTIKLKTNETSLEPEKRYYVLLPRANDHDRHCQNDFQKTTAYPKRQKIRSEEVLFDACDNICPDGGEVNLPSHDIDVIIKLGGSAITVKDKMETPKLADIGDAAKMIKLCLLKNLKCVVVHGAGSFGHHHAKEYGVHDGYSDGEASDADRVRMGFTYVMQSNLRLRQLILDALVAEGIPALVYSCFGKWETEAGILVRSDTSSVLQLVRDGFVPLLHGDTVLDRQRGCSILSGDTIIKALCTDCDVGRAVFLTDVCGIYDMPPQNPDAILLSQLSISGTGEITAEVVTQTSQCDITGGMGFKLETAAAIVMESFGKNPVFICKIGSQEAIDICCTGSTSGPATVVKML